jgi:hypothetical protein
LTTLAESWCSVEELVRGDSRRLRSRRAGPEPPVRPRLTGAWSPAAALPVRSCACPGIRISSPTRPACWMPATGTSFTGRPAVIPVAAARRVVGRDALAGVRGAVLGTGQPDAHAQRDVDQADGDRLALPWRRPVFPRRGPGSVTSPPLADTYRLPANSEPPVEDLLAAYSQMMEIPDIEVRSRAAAERVQRPGGRPRRRCLYPVGDRRAWPGAELIIIEDSGHTGSTTMTEEVHAAADRLYQQITKRS